MVAGSFEKCYNVALSHFQSIYPFHQTQDHCLNQCHEFRVGLFVFPTNESHVNCLGNLFIDLLCAAREMVLDPGAGLHFSKAL